MLRSGEKYLDSGNRIELSFDFIGRNAQNASYSFADRAGVNRSGLSADDNCTNPAAYTSHWPDGGQSRPRSATIVITRNDGGTIGA